VGPFIAEASQSPQVASPMLDALVGGFLFAVGVVSAGGPRNIRRALRVRPRNFVILALFVASAICLITAVFRVVH
jgi:hypothetical protein